MEEDGKRFYEKLAEETRVPELRTIYVLLAGSEEEHRKTLASMKENIAPNNAESKVLEKFKNVFQTLLERENLPEALKKDLGGCRHAIAMAMTGINLYERMSQQETNPEATKIMKILANEERKHLQIMENIYDFVEAPKDFLAWGEFSNLREL